MADKKITALTALDSTGKDPTDLLHIIDFSASPVNKKNHTCKLICSNRHTSIECGYIQL